MSANPHNKSAIEAMGSQFKNNIFDSVHKNVQGKLKRSIANDKRNAATPATPGVQSGSGATNFRPNSGSGTARPALSAGPRPARPHGNPAPTAIAPGTGGSAPSSTTITRPTVRPMSPVRSGLPGGAYNRPALPSGHRGTTPIALGPSSSGGSLSNSQFANVKPKDNSPYPTHQHPEGSSHALLPTLTANQPAPNQFTVGSRRSSSGIAAAGSRLEAWGQSKQRAVQARTASKRAGGRDRDLSKAASRAENFANQPLRNFAP